MPPGIGYGRDIPLAREGGAGGPEGSQVTGISPQQAVRILSFRVPERPSASGIAPLPLLQSMGGLNAGAGGLDALLQGLMAAFPQLPQQGQLGRGENPRMPSFGGPGTPSQRPGGQPQPRFEVPPLQPPTSPGPPRITPGDPGTPPPLVGDAGAAPGFQTDVTPLPIAQPPRRSPFPEYKQDMMDIQGLF